MGWWISAERTGFEPAVQFDPYTGLANRRFRPLSHLSEQAALILGTHKILRVSQEPARVPPGNPHPRTRIAAAWNRHVCYACGGHWPGVYVADSVCRCFRASLLRLFTV